MWCTDPKCKLYCEKENAGFVVVIYNSIAKIEFKMAFAIEELKIDQRLSK